MKGKNLASFIERSLACETKIGRAYTELAKLFSREPEFSFLWDDMFVDEAFHVEMIS